MCLCGSLNFTTILLLPFNGHFPGEPGLACSPFGSFSSNFSGREFLWISWTGFYGSDVFPVTQLSMLEHWRKQSTNSNQWPGLILLLSIDKLLPELVLLLLCQISDSTTWSSLCVNGGIQMCCRCVMCDCFPVVSNRSDVNEVLDPAYVNIAPCPCDLMPGACDVNCCCDSVSFWACLA